MENNIAFPSLEKIGWGAYQMQIFFLCGSSWFCFECWLISIAYLIQGLHEEWSTSTTIIGIIASFFHLGIFFGSIIWGLLSDKRGRLLPYRLCSILGLISSLVVVFGMHPWMVASGIFLLGVSNAGELTLSPTIFCEFCPPSKRYYLVMLSLFLSLGAVCVTGIALLVVLFNQTGFFTWRILAFALVFVQVGTVILKFSLDESPGYLCRVKEMRKAEEILNKISIRNKGITFEFDLATSVIGQHAEMGNVLPANSVLTDIQQNPPIWLIVKKLFGKKMVWTTLKISFAYTAALFSFSGFTSFMPELLGFLSKTQSYLVMMIQQAAGIPGVITGRYLVETRLGRKWTTSFGFFNAGVFSFVFYFSENIYFVIGSTFLIFYFTIIGYSSLFAVGSESFPTQVRSTGTSFVSIFSRIGGVSAPIISGVLLPTNGGFLIILSLFAASNIFCAIIIATLKETKMKSKTEPLKT